MCVTSKSHILKGASFCNGKDALGDAGYLCTGGNRPGVYMHAGPGGEGRGTSTSKEYASGDATYTSHTHTLKAAVTAAVTAALEAVGSMCNWMCDVTGASTLSRKLIVDSIRHGAVPAHVALIMDGNRRYARRQGHKTMYGHSKGFAALQNILSWCLDFGVKEVSVYAFSIENFRRSQEEVDGLMQLFKHKLKSLSESNLVDKYDVRIAIIGQTSLLSPDVRLAVQECLRKCESNQGPKLNIFIPYTSRQEMADTISHLAGGIRDGTLLESDVTESLFENTLYTAGSVPDLLIRTSGEVRLSDFMLWQASRSLILFRNVLWPDFGMVHLALCIFEYQRKFTDYARMRGEEAEWRRSGYHGQALRAGGGNQTRSRAGDGTAADARVDSFMERLRAARLLQVQAKAS